MPEGSHSTCSGTSKGGAGTGARNDWATYRLHPASSAGEATGMPDFNSKAQRRREVGAALCQKGAATREPCLRSAPAFVNATTQRPEQSSAAASRAMQMRTARQGARGCCRREKAPSSRRGAGPCGATGEPLPQGGGHGGHAAGAGLREGGGGRSGRLTLAGQCGYPFILAKMRSPGLKSRLMASSRPARRGRGRDAGSLLLPAAAAAPPATAPPGAAASGGSRRAGTLRAAPLRAATLPPQAPAAGPAPRPLSLIHI